MKFGVRSDTGLVRENNEDRFGSAPEIGLFVVSDGMGGMASGEVASRLAVETVVAHCREAEVNPALPLVGERIADLSDVANRLASAVRLANQVIFAAGEKDPEQHGMGATIVAARISDRRLSLAHAGDSRAYRLRDGRIEQLTQDHSFVAESVRQGILNEQEAGATGLQNVLVRALGIDPEVEVDVAEHAIADGDTFLLCSDGLTRELSDSQIAAVLAGVSSPEKAAGTLVDLANRAGGGDNVTAMVVRNGASPVAALARILRPTRWFRDFA